MFPKTNQNPIKSASSKPAALAKLNSSQVIFKYSCFIFLEIRNICFQEIFLVVRAASYR